MNTLTRLIHGVVASLVVASAAIAAAAAPMSASERFASLQSELRRTHTEGNNTAYLDTALALRSFLNGSPGSTLQLMSAQCVAGKPDDALRSFEQFVAMGQSNDDALQAKQFESLKSLEQYQAIHTAMDANGSDISVADKVFELRPEGLIPEDIDFDPATQLFYITSVLEQKIISVNMKGLAGLFAESPDHWPMMAIKVDSPRHLLWATEVAIDGFASVAAADWGRSAILVYDLSTGKLLQRIEGPPKTSLGDMTLDRNGDAIVSDGDHGGLYRAKRGSRQVERIDAGDFISPQTAAFLADGKHLLVPDYVRGVGVLDLSTKHVAWISMDDTHALNGIDGLYVAGGSLIATQNGTAPERVIRFGFDVSKNKITSETIIERATPTLRDPTHGVVIGEYFYYIANSGWDALDEHGTPKAVPALTKATIKRAKL
jgi:hypothetical protein